MNLTQTKPGQVSSQVLRTIFSLDTFLELHESYRSGFPLHLRHWGGKESPRLNYGPSHLTKNKSNVSGTTDKFSIISSKRTLVWQLINISTRI